jgi:hypothetical protein
VAVVGLLHLLQLAVGVGALGPCPRRRVEGHQQTAAAMGPEEAGGVESLGKGMGNPAGWVPYKLMDMMGGKCLVRTVMVEE